MVESTLCFFVSSLCKKIVNFRATAKVGEGKTRTMGWIGLKTSVCQKDMVGTFLGN